MFEIKIRRPGRGMILAFVGVIVLVGVGGFWVLEARAVNRLISGAREESAAFGNQMRDNALVFGVYRNGLARTGRGRKLIDEAESVQRKLGIVRAERGELVNTVEGFGAAERLLARKEIEGALRFCDERTTEYQSELDDLFGRLSESRPKFAGLRNRRPGRIPFLRFNRQHRSGLLGVGGRRAI